MEKIKEICRLLLGAAFLTAAIFAVAALALLAGCGGETGSDTGAADFPEFVFRSEESLNGYKIAVAHQDTLRYVPCYCGCQQDAEKYQSLLDCFIDRKTGAYDEHAAGCTTCLDEAIDIGQWQKEGLSRTEIRQRIDEKYQERGVPTATPMPPD